MPALLEAVEQHADGYVRFRALVLLSGFNDPRTRDVMRTSLDDRERSAAAVAYAYFEHNPDPRVVPRLLAALDARGVRVRPAGADARARRLRRRPEGAGRP